METLFKQHRLLISQVGTDIIREAMNTIKWEKQLVGIRGPRGVGKTTLMRQYIKLNYSIQAGEALYCLMDSMYFTNHSLLDLSERFHLMGGRHLFLDEVHKYPTWSKEVNLSPSGSISVSSMVTIPFLMGMKMITTAGSKMWSTLSLSRK